MQHRDFLALASLGPLCGLSHTIAPAGVPPEFLQSLVEANDSRMEPFMERQEADPNHIWFGGIRDSYDIYSVPATLEAVRIASAFLGRVNSKRSRWKSRKNGLFFPRALASCLVETPQSPCISTRNGLPSSLLITNVLITERSSTPRHLAACPVPPCSSKWQKCGISATFRASGHRTALDLGISFDKLHLRSYF